MVVEYDDVEGVPDDDREEPKTGCAASLVQLKGLYVEVHSHCNHQSVDAHEQDLKGCEAKVEIVRSEVEPENVI